MEVSELFFRHNSAGPVRVNKDPLNMKVVCTRNSIKEIEFKSLVLNPMVDGLEVES